MVKLNLDYITGSAGWEPVVYGSTDEIHVTDICDREVIKSQYVVLDGLLQLYESALGVENGAERSLQQWFTIEPHNSSIEFTCWDWDGTVRADRDELRVELEELLSEIFVVLDGHSDEDEIGEGIEVVNRRTELDFIELHSRLTS